MGKKFPKELRPINRGAEKIAAAATSAQMSKVYFHFAQILLITERAKDSKTPRKEHSTTSLDFFRPFNALTKNQIGKLL
jgi:hypothetical protein